MGAACLLHPHHDIVVFEKNAYVGGHSRTLITPDHVPVDTGFIVFNHRNYPLLTGLFKHYGVDTAKSNMSFGTSISKKSQPAWLEYSSKGVFAQKRNLIRPDFWRMLFDIVRFNKHADEILQTNSTISLRDYLKHLKMGDWFGRYYLQAMGAAIWSCSVETILDFPARSFIQFFKNHGLLTIKNHPQWYSVIGGSRAYVEKITASFADKIHLNCGAVRVTRTKDNQCIVTDTQGKETLFDHIIFACHADEALDIIDAPTDAEIDVLGGVAYQPNRAVLHQDSSFMPKNKKSWASWIYLSEDLNDTGASVSLTYWMNNLQILKTQNPVFVTLNPAREPQNIINSHIFTHPVFNDKTLKSQNTLPLIQGKDRLWFCGAWQRYGFHEDGLLSAVNLVKQIAPDLDLPDWCIV